MLVLSVSCFSDIIIIIMIIIDIIVNVNVKMINISSSSSIIIATTTTTTTHLSAATASPAAPIRASASYTESKSEFCVGGLMFCVGFEVESACDQHRDGILYLIAKKRK